MKELPNKPNPNKTTFAQSFVQNTHDAASLLQKELNVNHSEQTLLQKRIQIMEKFVNDLPASDPQYSMIVLAIKMDQIELDELRARALTLLQRTEEI